MYWRHSGWCYRNVCHIYGSKSTHILRIWKTIKTDVSWKKKAHMLLSHFIYTKIHHLLLMVHNVLFQINLRKRSNSSSPLSWRHLLVVMVIPSSKKTCQLLSCWSSVKMHWMMLISPSLLNPFPSLSLSRPCCSIWWPRGCNEAHCDPSGGGCWHLHG